LRHV